MAVEPWMRNGLGSEDILFVVRRRLVARCIHDSSRPYPSCPRVPEASSRRGKIMPKKGTGIRRPPKPQLAPPARIDADVLEAVGKDDQTLWSLDLSSKYVGPKAAVRLAKALDSNTRLTKLNLNTNELLCEGAEKIVHVLRKHPNITSLGLEGNRIDLDGAKAIAELLRENSILRRLDLNDNRIGPLGLSAIVSVIASGESVNNEAGMKRKVVEKKGNDGSKAKNDSTNKDETDGGGQKEDEGRANDEAEYDEDEEEGDGEEEEEDREDDVDERDEAEDEDEEKEQNNVEEKGDAGEDIKRGGEQVQGAENADSRVSLPNANQGDGIGKVHESETARNTTLKTLLLHSNRLGLEGAEHAAALIAKNGALTDLNLHYNDFGSRGGTKIAEALKRNATLTKLSLCGNSLGPEGAAAVAEAIRSQPSLKEVDLGGNSMVERGAEAIAAMLSDGNKGLERILLQFNSLGEVGAKTVAKAAMQHPELNFVDLRNNGLDDKAKKRVRKMVGFRLEVRV